MTKIKMSENLQNYLSIFHMVDIIITDNKYPERRIIIKTICDELRKEFTMLNTFEIKPNFAYLSRKYDLDPRTIKKYYNGYDDEKGKHHKGYVELIAELNKKFPLGTPIVGEQNEKDFISLFGAILKMRNILTSFDEFEGKSIISDRDLQDHQSNYLDLYNKWRRKDDAEKENINDDIVFEMELVRQVEVNIDYILILVSKYHKSNCEDKEILVDINKAINASTQLRSKKELIQSFIETINTSTQVEDDWSKFVKEQKEADLTAIVDEENLKPDETRKFIDNSFRDGELRTTGTAIDKILPPMPLFGATGNNRQTKKKTIVEKLSKFFEKYLGLV